MPKIEVAEPMAIIWRPVMDERARSVGVGTYTLPRPNGAGPVQKDDPACKRRIGSAHPEWDQPHRNAVETTVL
ncbi:hypothetical protein XH87_02630 [Bradyrhizobium sp. CCBAU 53415]|nr:hypothetical protein [Bradyrhizobium sp. CCBAU 53415]